MSRKDEREDALFGAGLFVAGCVTVVLIAAAILAYDGPVDTEIEGSKKSLLAAAVTTVVLFPGSRL